MTGISGEQAAHVLHHFGEGGFPPGAFTRTLIHAMTMADPANLAALALGFPGYAAAVRLAKDDFGGVVRLRQIAREAGLTR